MQMELYVVEGSGPLVTYQHKTLPHSSYIDHIIMSKNNPIPFSDCRTHSLEVENMSDHQPISITIHRQTSLQEAIKEAVRELVVPPFAWKDDNFTNEYSRLVDLNMINVGPNGDLNTICSLLHQCSLDAFKTCFPEKQKSPHSRPWWTAELSQYKQALSTHFNIWKEQGFPRDVDNVYFNRYLLARKHFRKAVKKAQNKKIYDSLNKMNILKNSHPKKFWSKIRKMRKTGNKRLFEINGKNTAEDITNEFADNFNSLLNNPIIEREDNCSRQIPPADTAPNELLLTTEDISEAISLLKENKAADPSHLVSEHIIYSNSVNFNVWMTNFYNNIFSVQSTPEGLSTSTIHPLVKSYKKSLKIFNNYRGISIIPVFTKILEYIILLKCPTISESHDLQHG